MTEKLYTEDQVQALIAAAYLYVNDEGQGSFIANAKAKLMEMLMEVATKTSTEIINKYFHPNDTGIIDLELIVNKVLGETS